MELFLHNLAWFIDICMVLYNQWLTRLWVPSAQWDPSCIPSSITWVWRWSCTTSFCSPIWINRCLGCTAVGNKLSAFHNGWYVFVKFVSSSGQSKPLTKTFTQTHAQDIRREIRLNLLRWQWDMTVLPPSGIWRMALRWDTPTRREQEGKGPELLGSAAPPEMAVVQALPPSGISRLALRLTPLGERRKDWRLQNNSVMNSHGWTGGDRPVLGSIKASRMEGMMHCGHTLQRKWREWSK